MTSRQFTGKNEIAFHLKKNKNKKNTLNDFEINILPFYSPSFLHWILDLDKHWQVKVNQIILGGLIWRISFLVLFSIVSSIVLYCGSRPVKEFLTNLTFDIDVMLL